MDDRSIPQTISVTGQLIETEGFSDGWKREVLGLNKSLASRYRSLDKERIIVAFGGPSGSSKSTTAAVLAETLPASTGVAVLHVTLDAYHFSNSLLAESRDANGDSMLEHKGRYDTYDIDSLRSDLAAFLHSKHVSFSEYSRVVHEPISDRINCTHTRCILILEGLWLLFDRTPWNDLLELYEYSVFFNAPDPFRKRSVIERHIRGGRGREESEKFYDKSDARNASLILGCIAKHDEVLMVCR